MNIHNNTVLISGGSAGIGLEIAQLLIEKGNHVIITGRNRQRLDAAAAQLGNVTAIPFDVTSEEEVDALVKKITSDHPGLNVLINNAGLGHTYSLIAGTRAWEKAAEEMNTNYISTIRLTEMLLPLLQKQKEAAVVNVTSIAAFYPNIKIPTYSASKAALHSYSMALRLVLRESVVKVFELMPPLVSTDFSESIGGKENGIPAVEVASALMTALENDDYEIRVGKTEKIYELGRTWALAALHALNGMPPPEDPAK